MPSGTRRVRVRSWPPGSYGFGSEGANVVPVSHYENFEEIKTLSPRIVVLRTMNRRIDELESVIRRSSFELEGLKAVKAGD